MADGGEFSRPLVGLTWDPLCGQRHVEGSFRGVQAAFDLGLCVSLVVRHAVDRPDGNAAAGLSGGPLFSKVAHRRQ